MQVKNRIFPYPILNHNKIFSNFDKGDFTIVYDGIENDDEYVLKNAKFETESKIINKLFDEGKIKISCIVECSNTVYRKSFPISKEGADIILPKVDFTEKVDISLFAYAVNDFSFSSDEFDIDYREIIFEIEKYDIIAANDGFNLTFIHTENEDSFAHSIFSITSSENNVNGAYTVECDASKKIIITMSPDDYKNYKFIYGFSSYKEVFFNMFLVPSLIEGLSLCQSYLSDSIKDLDDIGNNYMWFRSIIGSYKKLKGFDLTKEAFEKYSPAMLAQELLGSPLEKSLKCLNQHSEERNGDDENE